MPATRYLYVTRHAEAAADESALTEAGRRQA
ncbi:histidine phosphatase family protein, partial [Streptomyces sp. SID7982]|nr:histidine phosphatase family protein [Streptomyces sp. SID7982]